MTTNSASVVDLEIAEGRRKLDRMHPPGPPRPIGDWRSRRTRYDAKAAMTARWQSVVGDVRRRDVVIPNSCDDTTITGRWYTTRQPSTCAVLFIHGGGMISGSVDLYDPIVAGYVARTGVSFLSVDYRLSPESPFPGPLNDCESALSWLRENADVLRLDSTRIAVMGDSAGGCLAAGLSVKLRDEGRWLPACQILVQPMLDHRTAAPGNIHSKNLTWSVEDNVTGWSAYLGSQEIDSRRLGWASPGVAPDLEGLPPTWMEVCQLDLFAAEGLEFAARLSASGVETEVHSWPRVPHAFEWYAPSAMVAQKAIAARCQAILSLHRNT